MNHVVSGGSRVRFGLLIAVLFGGLASADARAGALEDYVRQPDPSFNWKRTQKKALKAGGTLSHLELVSQTWRDQFWSHHLMVFQPATVRQSEWALLFVTGGSYNAPNEKELDLLKAVADRAGVLVGILNKVPNQPLYDGRYEDALIAHTFDQYLKTGDQTWPLLFPMVKSAVRGMDTLQQFAAKEWGYQVGHFVVSGASKRGWTTWLTGAVDPRVKAVAPMVIDMLNMKAQLGWAEKVYGRQSEEINDYTDINLHMKQDDPAMIRLREWVDPYAYRARYQIPKLLLLGTNDPYWTVDSLRHYWNELLEPKAVFQTPNAGHDLAGGEQAVETLAAFVEIVSQGGAFPSLDWTFQPGQSGAQARLKVSRPARGIRVWTADSKDRDFRDDEWTARELALADGGTSASTEIAQPAAGYRAYLLEATLTSPGGHEFRLSTEARVTPDTQP